MQAATQTSKAFLDRVNLTLHKYESQAHDEIRANRWRSLPRQFDLAAKPKLTRPFPVHDGHGVRISELRQLLRSHDLISARTYSHVGAIWRRKSEVSA